MGFVVVTPHFTPDNLLVDRKGRRYKVDPLGPMKTVKPSGGKVRIGYGDGTKVVGFKFVPVAPVVDPLADSMGPWA